MIDDQQTYGKKIDYDPQWEGPLKIERRQTDHHFLLSLGVYLVLWIGIAIYAFENGDVGIASYTATHVVKEISPGSIFQEANTILGFSLFTIFLSVIYIMLLRWFTKAVVYIGIFLLCAVLFVTVCIASYAYTTYQEPIFLGLLIASVIIFIVTVIVFTLLRKKIKIACVVIKVSSKVVLFFPSSLLFPILPYILYGIVITFTVATYIFLSSLKMNYTLVGRSFHFINAFGFLWLTCYVTAFSQMILSGSFATYYWARNKNHIPSYTILSFMGITVRYHLGTIAAGSLIIAICKFIRSLLNIKEDGSAGKCNPIACLCCGCYKCLCGNLERFLRYINRNAYIMCSIHGTKYFESAKDAFNLLMRNILKVLVINKVTGAVLFFGQLLVIGISALATYGYCKHYGESSVVYVAVPSVILSAIAVTESFFTVLRIAIDTVFLSVLEDFERNDGSINRPYFMSPEMQAALLKDSKGDRTTEDNDTY